MGDDGVMICVSVCLMGESMKREAMKGKEV